MGKGWSPEAQICCIAQRHFSQLRDSYVRDSIPAYVSRLRMIPLLSGNGYDKERIAVVIDGATAMGNENEIIGNPSG